MPLVLLLVLLLLASLLLVNGVTVTVPLYLEGSSVASESVPDPATSSVPKDGLRILQALPNKRGGHPFKTHSNSNSNSNSHGVRPPELMSTVDHLHHSYGSDLPAFTHDYSELMISAMVERGGGGRRRRGGDSLSDSLGLDNLYLTMFLMGHKVLVDNFPFESLSTDEHILLEW